jgi:hypothetical protein
MRNKAESRRDVVTSFSLCSVQEVEDVEEAETTSAVSTRAALPASNPDRRRRRQLHRRGPSWPRSDERPGVIFIAGEAGIGKSRLIDESLGRLSRPILRGEAAAESMSPYAALVQVIRAFGRDHHETLMGLPMTRHLSLLLPEQSVGQDETDQPTLRTAICDVAAAAGDVESILVLEDLHWADEGTLEVLLELAKVPERSALSIVATYRNDELPRLHRLRSAR